MSKSYPSLLNREESAAIKGLLILLIVLAHNSIVMGATGLFSYFYSFHVYCFYILPFIYGFRNDNTHGNPLQCLCRRQWNNWKKLGMIYLFWCLVGACYYVVSKHVPFSASRWIHAVSWGNQILLAESCSFAYLWFLPTILAVMFWRDLFFCSDPLGKLIIFLVGILLWGAAVAGFGSFHTIGFFFPFALIQGLFFSASGIATRFILEHRSNKNGRISRYFIFMFPLVPLYVYIRRYLPYGCTFLTWSCCPVIAFICFFSVKDWLCKVSFFQVAGKYSLQIYLLHTIIFNILVHIVPYRNLVVGVFVYILTLLLCGAVIYCIDKTKIFRWTIFPHHI